MTYRVATIEDVTQVYDLMSACANQLRTNGYSNWDHITFEQIKEKVQKGNTYILEDDDAIVGTVTANKRRPTFFVPQDKQYWTESCKRPGYIRSLAVHPAHQTKGYGASLMHIAEDILRDKGRNIARLTAVSRNTALCEWYESLGYTVVQQRLVPERNTILSFFEKKL